MGALPSHPNLKIHTATIDREQGILYCYRTLSRHLNNVYNLKGAIIRALILHELFIMYLFIRQNFQTDNPLHKINIKK